MKNKSSKLIFGIVLLIIAVIVLLANLVSYWIAIALAAIGLILIISRSSESVEKKESPVSEPEELLTEEEIIDPVEENPSLVEEDEKDVIIEEDANPDENKEEITEEEEEEKSF